MSSKVSVSHWLRYSVNNRGSMVDKGSCMVDKGSCMMENWSSLVDKRSCMLDKGRCMVDKGGSVINNRGNFNNRSSSISMVKAIVISIWKTIVVSIRKAIVITKRVRVGSHWVVINKGAVSLTMARDTAVVVTIRISFCITALAKVDERCNFMVNHRCSMVNQRSNMVNKWGNMMNQRDRVNLLGYNSRSFNN